MQKKPQTHQNNLHNISMQEGKGKQHTLWHTPLQILFFLLKQVYAHNRAKVHRK